MSFGQLVNKYAIHRKHYFKYLQLRSFILAQIHSIEAIPVSYRKHRYTFYGYKRPVVGNVCYAEEQVE